MANERCKGTVCFLSLILEAFITNQYIFILTRIQNVSENDQEISQSHTADQPTAPRGRAIEHLFCLEIGVCVRVKQCVSFVPCAIAMTIIVNIVQNAFLLISVI